MSPELSRPDMFRTKMTELARNLVWQYGDVFLSTSQQVSLFGNEVELNFQENRGNRPDSLPLADVDFINKKAAVTFVQEDYEYVLDAICKPENINGHKAAAFYIGSGIAPAVLHKFLAIHRNYGMIDNVYSHLSMMPPKQNLTERILIHQGTEIDFSKLVDTLFENIMSSDEKRAIRINMMRYGIGSLFRIMESTDVDWELWQRDDKDRVGYIFNFRDACTSELADMLRSQYRLDIITKSLGKTEDWQSKIFYDRVPELLIAGSMPMTSEEIDELNSFLEIDA